MEKVTATGFKWYAIGVDIQYAKEKMTETELNSINQLEEEIGRQFPDDWETEGNGDVKMTVELTTEQVDTLVTLTSYTRKETRARNRG